MKSFISFLLLFSLFIVSQQVISQDSWSLTKCIDYALENNIQIKQQELSVKYQDNTLKQSKFDLIPNLNASASENLSFGRSVDLFTNEYTTENVSSNNFSLSSSVTLFSGLQKFNTIKKNELNLKSEIANLEKAKNDVALNISASYLQILYAIELLKISEEQVLITKQQVSQTEKLVNAGSMAKGSLLEVQAELAAKEVQLVERQSELDLSYLTLVQLLELESVENFEIEVPDISSFNISEKLLPAKAIYDVGVQKLPQISKAQYDVLSAGKDLEIAKGGYFPRLSLSSSYYTGYSNNRTNLATGEVYPFSDQIKNNAYKSLGFSLSVPIFNNLYTKTSVDNAKIALMNNELNLEYQKNVLFADIQKAHSDALSASKNFDANKKALAAMEESFRYMQQKFDVGMVTLVDYNLAKVNLADTKSNLLQAKYNFIFKSLILDFYRGEKIGL